MTISRLDPADADRVDGVLAVLRAAHEADLPRDPMYCPSWDLGQIHDPIPSEAVEHWIAVEGAEVTGVAEVQLPLLDNLGTAFVQVTVTPGARGRGTGRALYDAGVARARAQSRKLAMFETPRDGPGAAFAKSLGAELGILSARRHLAVDAEAAALAGELAAAAAPHAVGYEVRTFAGSTPEGYVADLAYLTGRMSTDAPLDDLALEPEAYDVERVRLREAALDKRGRRKYCALAIELASGTVVGYSDVAFQPEDPTHAWQWDTIVDPVHRGHRLGTLIKCANLRFVMANEPALRTISTWNAVSNGPMIAVNEAMGFRLWDHWCEWQVGI